MRDRTIAALLAIAAIAACARTIPTGYLCDDWVIVSHVSRNGNADAWSGPFLDLGPESCNYYRPIFSGLYDLEYRVFGANPLPAHIHHVLWHGLAAALLFLILRRLGCGRSAASLGALLFAWHPHLGGSTGWLAARGGIVVATLGLGTFLAWLFYRERTTALPYTLSLLLSVLAVCTYEHGYVALVLPLTVDLVLSPRPSIVTLLKRHAPFAIAGVALLFVRYHALGTLAGGYPYPAGILVGGDTGREALEATGMTALRMPLAMPEGIVGIWPGVVVGSLSALVAVVALARPLRHRLVPDAPPPPRAGAARLLGVLLLWHFLLLALPADPTLIPGTGHRWYGALAYFGGLLAVIAEPLLRRGWVAILPALLVPAYLCGFLLVQNQFVAAERDAQRVIATALEALADESLPEGPLFLTALPESRRSMPTLQWGISEALRPPFQDREPPMAVYPIHRFMFLGPQHAHPFHPPVEVLFYAGGGDPLILSTKEPWDPDSAEVARIQFTEPDNPATMTPRESVQGLVRGVFAAEPLTVITPEQTVNDVGETFDVRVVVRAPRCDAVELFVFTPTFNTRRTIPIVDDVATADLGPVLRDYVSWRGEPADIYVIAIGYRGAEPTRPLMSPLLTWRYRP